MVVKGKRKG